MAWTDAEIQRIVKIEQALNNLQVALDKAVTLSQLRKSILVKQNEIDQMKTDIESLKAQVQVLQA